ncbi:MAG TPA: hypothetical protein VMH77_03335 [Steroidobacteraceae bacterium]|nr:hypothetical protein [Steroidobacteraceae bacterium]
MSTYLRLLRIAFWMSPLQRWCTAGGLGVGIVVGNLLLAPTNFGFNLMMLGLLAALVLPLLLGGALWRALSAQRVIRLAPYGRARMLSGALGVILTIALLCTACVVLFHLGQASRYGVVSSAALGLLILDFCLATCWAVASFVASRSPLAMLILLLGVIAGVLHIRGIDSSHFAEKQDWATFLPMAACAAFGIWYLRARRIRSPGWLLPGGQSVIAAVAIADTTVAGISQRAALERLLLGGASTSRLLVQWLLAGGLLLLVQLVYARIGDRSDPQLVAQMLFDSLVLCPLVVLMLSLAAVRRARALWLCSGYSRAGLFACTERVLLKLAVGMGLLFAFFLLVLWYTQPWHPAITLPQALCVVLVPPLLVASHGLCRPRGHDYYWRWPVVLLLCWSVAWKPLTEGDPAVWSGLRGWTWIAAALLCAIALRELARVRWLAGDFPRVTSPSAAS